MRIDGVECDLFSNHAPLGQTTLREYVVVPVPVIPVEGSIRSSVVITFTFTFCCTS